MSILSKIKSSLFAEEDADYEELEQEETVKTNEKKDSYESKVQEMSVEDEHLKRMLAENEVKKEKPIVGMTVDTVNNEKVKANRKERRSAKSILERKDYEIPEVVSPIFGSNNLESEESNKSEDVTFSRTNNKNKSSRFGDVISPFYGDSNDKNVDLTDSQHIIKKNNDDKKINFKSNVNSNDFGKHAAPLNDEDVENISLDSLISEEKSNDDEMIQFSLFSDEQVIKEDEYTQEIDLSKEREKM